MNIKNISILLIICLFFLFILIVHHKRKNQILENFADTTSNIWTTNKTTLSEEKAPLNNVQKTEVENMIKALSKDTVKTMVASQSASLAGPQGPQGNQGPSGAQYIASGRIINKGGSFATNNENANFFAPEMALSRSSGTNPSSSLAFMDVVSPFASYQNWELDINNNLKNRFDETCLSINPTTKAGSQNKIYMDKCDSNNQNQKWTWDSSNRLISTSSSTSKTLKCLGLSNPEKNIITSVPGCKGNNCMNNNIDKKYVVVKDCDINTIKDDELWTFI